MRSIHVFSASDTCTAQLRALQKIQGMEPSGTRTSAVSSGLKHNLLNFQFVDACRCSGIDLLVRTQWLWCAHGEVTTGVPQTSPIVDSVSSKAKTKISVEPLRALATH